MRPGQNKRMRGRNNNNPNNNRRGPNPLTRSYESNGPDVKIRGTAHHVGEKYLQLARDAQSSGDPVMAESYLQHAEHYFRLIAAAQLAQQQAQFGYQRPPGEVAEPDEDADDDFESLPDRFASPSERAPQVPQAQPQQQPYEGRNDRPYGEKQPYENRNNQANNGHYADRQQSQDRGNDNRPRHAYADRPDRNAGQQERYDRNNGQGNNGQAYERQGQDRSAQDRSAQDRPAQDRSGNERQSHERQGQGQERSGQERPAQDRNGQDRNGQQAGGTQRDDRQGRDYDNRNFRNRGREFRDQPRSPVPDEQPSVGLPAFITGPSRVAVAEVAELEQPIVAPVESSVPSAETGDDASFHLRPRRRRRPKAELADSLGESAAGSGERADQD